MPRVAASASASAWSNSATSRSHGSSGVPVQCMRIGGEELLPVRERLAQLVEQLAQVVARLGLGCVGPEEEGEMLALLGDIPMQHEIGEQRTQAHGIEAGDWLRHCRAG